jgi:hypothetical protein
MAYGDNLFMEFKSGYIRMSCIRTSLTRYVQVKFIVNGIVAFFTVAIPSTILLLVCSILFTREIPTQNMYRVFWNPHGEFTSIYYNHPYGFMFAEILIMGLFAFSYSCLSFAISFYTKHKTVTLLFPFFVYMLFQTYCDRAGLISIQPRLSLLFYLESSHNLTVNIMESVAIVVISIILIKIKPKGDLVL